jgi:hypothetical protein
MDLREIGIKACVVIVLSAIAAGLFYGLWLLVAQVEHGVLAAWTLASFVLILLAGLGGYKLGTLEARGVLRGIGLGTGPVVQTADKIATVKAGAVQKMKEPDPVIVELPRMRMIDVTPRQLPSGNDQVVM